MTDSRSGTFWSEHSDSNRQNTSHAPSVLCRCVKVCVDEYVSDKGLSPANRMLGYVLTVMYTWGCFHQLGGVFHSSFDHNVHCIFCSRISILLVQTVSVHTVQFGTQPYRTVQYIRK